MTLNHRVSSANLFGKSFTFFVCSLLTAAVCFCLTGVAQAAFIGTDLVWVAMTDDQGRSASHGVANPLANLPPQAKVPDHVREKINDRFDLWDDGQLLGSVDELEVFLEGDPVASINFAVTAGASDVTVTVSSATVSFPALMNPPASAEAEITLTDNGGSPATIETVGANPGLFRAIYNGSETYAWLLGNSSVGGGEVTFSQDDTSGSIAGAVTSIQAQFSFRLSAGDSATGSGTFTVVPEPTSAGLLLCAGLLLTASGRRSRIF